MARYICFIVLIALLALAGCSMTNHAPTGATMPSADAAPKPINKFCAVEQDNPVDDRVPVYMYNGKAIGFCCPDCVDTFKQNPEKYMATLK